MRIFSKDKVRKNVITDQGIVKKTDKFSIAVIIISNVVSAILLVLGVLIFINS
ncbi:MAG: hypothetical protein K6G65_06670 [Lachnospiraceae bacterium]|nr:hypothetical protein [Lachnospiraceae bacterium]